MTLPEDSGMYFRVMRDGKPKNLPIERLTHDERHLLLERYEHDALVSVIHHLSRCVVVLQEWLADSGENIRGGS